MFKPYNEVLLHLISQAFLSLKEAPGKSVDLIEIYHYDPGWCSTYKPSLGLFVWVAVFYLDVG